MRHDKVNKILTCTMGAATDLLNQGLRRLLVNGAYWAIGVPIPRKANVDIVGLYRPSPFGFDGFKKGVKPGDGQVPPKYSAGTAKPRLAG